MFKACIIPIIIYGYKAWSFTEQELGKAGELRFKRAIKAKTRWERLRNEELRKELVWLCE